MLPLIVLPLKTPATFVQIQKGLEVCYCLWAFHPDPSLGPILVVQHCDPPYRTKGYSYTYRIYVFQCIAGYRAITPPPFGGYRKIMLKIMLSRGGG